MIRKYNESDFELLESWITNSDLLFQFAGTDFQFPLTKLQITNYQILNSNRIFYIFTNDDGIEIGFGEIIPQENSNPRLGRLLIGNNQLRNKGFGKQFVCELIEECKVIFNPKAVDLYVWGENKSAIKCYENVGFEFTKDISFNITHNIIEFPIRKMSYLMK